MTNEIAVNFSALIEPPSGGQKVSAFYSQSHFATLPQQLSEAHSAQTHRNMPIRCTMEHTTPKPTMQANAGPGTRLCTALLR